MAWSLRPKVINTVPNSQRREYGSSAKEGAFECNQRMIRGRYEVANNLYRKDLFSHFGCVNAIEFSTNGQWLVSGGDDRRTLLWNVEQAISSVGQPHVMKGEHNSNIFCLGFDSQHKHLFSAGNDEQVIIHDSETGEPLDVILHGEAIYGLSVDPLNDSVFATACDDGRIFIWDIREPNAVDSPRDPMTQIRSQSAFHAVQHNPVEPRLIATANSKEGVGLWDLRNPRSAVLQYTDCLLSNQSAMSVRFNSRGTQILALRRRFPPILYNVTSPYPVAEFDHSSYYNSSTMKSCCFAGDQDQYVLSGSDDFKLYVWKIPEKVYSNELSSPQESIWVDEAHLVLYGHRSIVNQVRYNYANSIIASSGVEKVVKLWSVFPLPFGTGGLELPVRAPKDNRKVYSHEDYINLVLESGQFMTHDYSHQSVQEDPRMMAFFDSLVQRDIEGWTSDSSDESIDGSRSGIFEYCLNISGPSGISSDSEGSTSSAISDTEDPLRVLNPHTVSYISSLSNRIETNIASYPSLNAEEPSTSASTSSAAAAPVVSLISVSTDDITSDANKISQLIHEKKREQLRKVARVAVKGTKRRLKRAKRVCRTSAAPFSKDEGVKFQKRIEELGSIVEKLTQSVGADLRSSEGSNGNSRRNSYKLRRRLRYLTNQSDFILNEVLPGQDSDSDSSHQVSGDEFFEVLTNEVQMIRNLPEHESSSDSDSSTDTLEPNVLVGDSSSSSDEEEDNGKSLSSETVPESGSDDSNDEQEVISRDRRSTGAKLALPVEEEESDEEPDEETIKWSENSTCNNSIASACSSLSGSGSKSLGETANLGNCTLQSGPIVQCPYLHNICHTSNSVKCSDCSKEHPSSSSSPSSVPFKSVNNHSNRSYRKRKHPEENGASPGEEPKEQVKKESL